MGVKIGLLYVLANLYVKEKRFVNLYSLPPIREDKASGKVRR
jgi:hypothetical protein